jgi:hypothetical protein
MTKRYLGNIITQNPTAPAGSYENDAASGVWSLAEAFAYNKAGLWPTAGNAPPTAFFNTGASDISLEKVLIGSLGNTTDFGDMSIKEGRSGIASSTRGIFTSGKDTNDADPNDPSTLIEYFEMSTGGTLLDFGDLPLKTRLGFGLASATRGISGGGNSVNAGTGQQYPINNINYLTIASTGDAADFGDLTLARRPSGGGSSATRGVIMGGGFTGGSSNIIDYITIASTGNATDFGDMLANRKIGAGASNSTRAITAGTDNNVIEYITIASTGNSTDFGDLLGNNEGQGGCASSTRMLMAGGQSNNTRIEYIEINTTGNSADFGDLITGTSIGIGALSNAHGGLAA